MSSHDSEDDDFLERATPFVKQQSSQPKIIDYLKKVESDAKEECNALINKANQVEPKESKACYSYEYYTVYYDCPICSDTGFKTIQHIKLCANKYSKCPKDVIYRLRSWPKDIRQKFASNKTKPVRKNKTKDLEKQYELLIFDQQYKEELVQKRVSKLLMNQQELCKQPTTDAFLTENSLPLSWKMSHLNFDSEQYIIEEFSKYFH